MKKLYKKYYGEQIIVIVLLGLILPWISKAIHLTVLTRIIWLYITFNSLYMLYLGYVTRKKGFFPAILLLMPTLFAVVTTWWLGIVSSEYGYYLAGFYLILELFTFFGDTRDDPDENLIPIENGFSGLSESDK